MHTPAKRALNLTLTLTFYLTPRSPTQAALWQTRKKHMEDSHLPPILFGGTFPVSKLLYQGYRARPLPIFSRPQSPINSHTSKTRDDDDTTDDDTTDDDTTGDYLRLYLGGQPRLEPGGGVNPYFVPGVHPSTSSITFTPSLHNFTPFTLHPSPFILPLSPTHPCPPHSQARRRVSTLLQISPRADPSLRRSIISSPPSLPHSSYPSSVATFGSGSGSDSTSTYLTHVDVKSSKVGKNQRKENPPSATTRAHQPTHPPTHLAFQYPYWAFFRTKAKVNHAPLPHEHRSISTHHHPASYLPYIQSTEYSHTSHPTLPQPQPVESCAGCTYLPVYQIPSLLLRVSAAPTNASPNSSPPHSAYCSTALSRFFCVAAPASHGLLHPASQIRQESVAFSGLPSAISSSQVPTSTPGQIQTHANPDQRRRTPYAIRKEEPFDIPSSSSTPPNLWPPPSPRCTEYLPSHTPTALFAAFGPGPIHTPSSWACPPLSYLRSRRYGLARPELKRRAQPSHYLLSALF
ncbi:hypothetical protein CSAL01_10452 [Colletotrichum salicis]|uniref:Uncharacterized protein n=1 Tax=Colletotrichum salicis TaxID=1209931 RepID=A0A135V2A6_9PEZI|nr:hypothetical protein CSAL01_10452 [Colletotrichum salicis]